VEGGAQVHLVGSSRTGLYLPSSDVDLVVLGRCWPPTHQLLNPSITPFLATSLFYTTSFSPPLPRWPALPLTTLERLLTSTLAAPRSVVVLAHATVPLVQYTDSSTGLKVDLSFNMTDGVAAAQLVIAWRRVMPALGPLLQDC